MSRGLGRNELALLEVLGNSGLPMLPKQIARVLLEKDWRSRENVYDNRYQTVAIHKALASLMRKGLVQKVPSPFPLYELKR
jgi:hypothetical protein